MNPQQRLQDAVDHSEISRLHAAYADVVSRRQWHELSELFTPDAVLDLDLRGDTMQFVGPQAIGDFISQAVDQFEFFQFGIIGARIHLRGHDDPDRATARMYMTEIRQTPAGHWSQIYGVYHDRHSRIDGQWLFTHRTYHSLARNNQPAAVFEFPHHLRLPEL